MANLKTILQNYFLGKDLKETYQRQREFYQEHTKGRERSFALEELKHNEFRTKTFCYRLPNIITVVGIATGTLPLIVSGETTRWACRRGYDKVNKDLEKCDIARAYNRSKDER